MLSEAGHGFLVSDAQAATRIYIVYTVTTPFERPQQIGHPFHGQCEWSHVGDLRADVYTHARDPEISCSGGLGIQLSRLADGHAEFVLLQAGGNIRVSVGRNVRVHT